MVLSSNMTRKLQDMQQQSPEDLYRNLAETRQAKRSQSHIQVILTFIGMGVGYSAAAMTGAIGVGLIGAAYIGWSWWDAYQALDDLENGDLDVVKEYLTPQERQRLEADMKAIDTTAEVVQPAAIAPTTTTTATTIAPPTPGAAAAIAPPPTSAQWAPAQWWLWNRLMGECPDLRYAIFGNLVVISGPQQSGKSSLAAAIAYCRTLLMGGHLTVVTPHIDGRKVFAGDVVGSGGNFDAIDDWYTNLKDGFSMGGDRTTLVIDELSQYVDDWQPLGQSIVRTAITESTKHGLDPILINHATTVSAGFANIKGVRELINTSAVQVNRQYEESTWGATQRSPVITITRPGRETIEVTVPAWFHLPNLVEAHGAIATPEAVAPTPAPAHTPTPAPAPPALSPFDWNTATAQATNTIDLDSLPAELKAIAQYAAKQNGAVTARDCQRNITGFSSHSAGQVRSWFRQLAAQDVGMIQGDSDALKYQLTCR